MNKGYVFTILNYSITDTAKQYTRIKTANRLVNLVLKEIGKTLEIETLLTTIKEMMGHTKEEPTEIYLGQVVELKICLWTN